MYDDEKTKGKSHFREKKERKTEREDRLKNGARQQIACTANTLVDLVSGNEACSYVHVRFVCFFYFSVLYISARKFMVCRAIRNREKS